MWGIEELDLAEYLNRVGVDASQASLHRLHRAHTGAIPFENIDVYLGKGAPLDLPSIQAKLTGRQRGGYCYEHALLFAAALERLGFSVTRQLARIRMGSEQVRARTHGMLLVESEGSRWLADVGFGGEGLLEPIRFADGATVTVGAWTWRLVVQSGRTWVLQSLHADGWFDLYSFQEEDTYPADYTAANHVTSTLPTSPFVTQAIAQRTAPDIRHTLRNGELTVSTATGVESRVATPAEVPAILADVFGIHLTETEAKEVAALAG
ncbi:arylamine N-acetyltransferase family protein [Longispora albida]|uniref:arylamine N-acetyltransferase family protein n=1 Tax=Longispora albida TaxID=203523 RepID=UPI000371791E|nr:arylamine N-acetyltransferase [Longispora albida]